MDREPMPRRLIAAGSKPFGHRVNIYQRMSIVEDIIQSLDESELDFIRKSSLGPILELLGKPAWSGGFGLFLMTRQLEIAKKNELWVTFAGSPIRFSLREFKIVTNLRCGKYPVEGINNRKDKKSKNSTFYEKLFGDVESVTVERVITLLRRRRGSQERGNRLRYACLALVDGILLPTNHFPKLKIVREHAEMSENLDRFLEFPWGRKSFDRIMESIKDRDIAQLATSDIAVQGLFLALQLVVLEAVPAIIGQSDDPSTEEDEDFVNEVQAIPQLKLSRVRELDQSSDVLVESIIRPDTGPDELGEDLSWSDDGEDEKVDNMVRLINEGFQFKSEMFVGGCKPADLVGLPPKSRSRASKLKNGRGNKGKSTVRQPCGFSKRKRGDDASPSGCVEVADSGRAAELKQIERNFARIVEEKIAEGTRQIFLQLTKWLKENSIVEEVSIENNGSPLTTTGPSNAGISDPPHATPTATQTPPADAADKQKSSEHQHSTVLDDTNNSNEELPESFALDVAQIYTRQFPNDEEDGETGARESTGTRDVDVNANAAEKESTDPTPADRVQAQGRNEVASNAAATALRWNAGGVPSVRGSDSECQRRVTPNTTKTIVVAADAALNATLLPSSHSTAENSVPAAQAKENSNIVHCVPDTVTDLTAATSNLADAVRIGTDQGPNGVPSNAAATALPSHDGSGPTLPGSDSAPNTENTVAVAATAAPNATLIASPQTTAENSVPADQATEHSSIVDFVLDTVTDVTASTSPSSDAVRLGTDQVGGDVYMEPEEEGEATESENGVQGRTDDSGDNDNNSAEEPPNNEVEEEEDDPKPSEVQTIEQTLITAGDAEPKPEEKADVPRQRRASKRSRTTSTRLDENQYDVGKRLKSLTGQQTTAQIDKSNRLQKRFDAAMASIKSAKVGPCSITAREIKEFLERKKTPSPKVMDGMCKLTRRILRSDEVNGQKLRVEVLDTKFVSQIGRLYPKFLKEPDHSGFQFPEAIVQMLLGVGDTDRVQLFDDADVLYLPFNFNKMHWVALAVHLFFWRIDVLDCNVSRKTDASIQETMKPLATMLPYLFRQVATTPMMANVKTKPLDVVRVSSLPQAIDPADSCLMSILYMQAHGVGGLDDCNNLDPSALGEDAKKMVMCLVENFSN